MSGFDNAKALVVHSEGEYKNIEEGYKSSLGERAVKAAMLISIKNFMENLRSALDYSACAIFEKYGNSKKSDPKIYFPYALETQSLADFRASGKIESCIPGVSAHSKVVSALESFQHFSASEFKWVPKFMALNNENKHQNLTPQTRAESKQMNLKSGGAVMSLGGGATISIGKGASISFGGMKIEGGQTFDVNNPPKVSGDGKVEVVTWVSFHFSDNKEPVLPLLKSALMGTTKIVETLSAI